MRQRHATAMWHYKPRLDWRRSIQHRALIALQGYRRGDLMTRVEWIYKQTIDLHPLVAEQCLPCCGVTGFTIRVIYRANKGILMAGASPPEDGCKAYVKWIHKQGIDLQTSLKASRTQPIPHSSRVLHSSNLLFSLSAVLLILFTAWFRIVIMWLCIFPAIKKRSILLKSYISTHAASCKIN